MISVQLTDEQGALMTDQNGYYMQITYPSKRAKQDDERLQYLRMVVNVAYYFDDQFTKLAGSVDYPMIASNNNFLNTNGDPATIINYKNISTNDVITIEEYGLLEEIDRMNYNPVYEDGAVGEYDFFKVSGLNVLELAQYIAQQDNKTFVGLQELEDLIYTQEIIKAGRLGRYNELFNPQ